MPSERPYLGLTVRLPLAIFTWLVLAAIPVWLMGLAGTFAWWTTVVPSVRYSVKPTVSFVPLVARSVASSRNQPPVSS